MKRSLPQRLATWRWILCLALLLACRAFADDNVIGKSGEGSQKAATASKESPDNASGQKLESGIAALQEHLKHLKKYNQSLEELQTKLSKTAPTLAASPRPDPVQTSKKAPAADWAGTWVGELTCIDSPQGDEGRTAVFVVRICTDHSRATLQAGNTPPMPCSVVLSGSKLTSTGTVRGTSSGTMKVITVMRRAGRNLSSVTVRTINDRGITSAVAGEMERQ